MKVPTLAWLASAVILAATPGPADAKWTEPQAAARIAVAQNSLSVVPGAGWNRWSKKPIKKGELWSFDGPLLNTLEFFGGISNGEPLAREINKKREPLPKFATDMRPSEIADLFERTIRATKGAPDFTTQAVQPAPFAGHPGFRLAFRYTVGELTNRGEARGAVVDGKLYLISYTAPALYYFDAGLPRAAALMDSATLAH